MSEVLAQELKQIQDALALITRRFPEYEFVKKHASNGHAKAAPGVAIATDAGPEEAREPLIKAVERVVVTNHAREWTSAQIYARLEKEEFPLAPPKQQRMANISTALGKLCGRNNPPIRMAYKGSGRDPNRYRAVQH